jgi:sulfur carrier protein ThiS
MKKIIILYDGKEREMKFSDSLTGYDLAKEIGQFPDNVIIIKDKQLIPIDEEILDGDRIKIIRVSSRG